MPSYSRILEALIRKEKKRYISRNHDHVDICTKKFQNGLSDRNRLWHKTFIEFFFLLEGSFKILNIVFKMYVYNNIPFAARIVPDKFTDIVGGNGEDERITTSLQQVDEHLKELVILLDESRCILTPETLRFVDGAPLEAASLDLSGVFVK